MNPMTLPPTGTSLDASWALRMKATTMDEPTRVIPTLTGAILGNGGWVLSRGADDSGHIHMLFEFERMYCVEIYTLLIAAGLELSQLAHLRFTELCQCTKSHYGDCGGEIVSVDLEIHSFAVHAAAGGRSASEAA
jgi:hypothetical protein